MFYNCYLWGTVDLDSQWLIFLPTTQTSSAELYLTVWRAIKLLTCYGFSATYISLDGAQANRDLMKMFLPPDQRSSDTITTVTFPNVFDHTQPKITIIMDYSHLIKKIRNNISKSGHMKHHKKLKIKGLLHYMGALEQSLSMGHCYTCFKNTSETNT